MIGPQVSQSCRHTPVRSRVCTLFLQLELHQFICGWCYMSIMWGLCIKRREFIHILSQDAVSLYFVCMHASVSVCHMCVSELKVEMVIVTVLVSGQTEFIEFKIFLAWASTLTHHFVFQTQTHVRVYNLQKQTMLKNIRANSRWVSSIGVHPGGEHFLIGTFDRKVSW